MKQKIEIEVDVPDGYELVGFGQPCIGEYGFDILCNVLYGPFNKYDFERMSISLSDTIRLKKKEEYKWPDFIKSGSYLCMNSCLSWHLSTRKPTLTVYGWTAEYGHLIPTTNFNMSTPDTPSDWTKSLIRKP